jgi:hypothetical protein
MEAGTQFLELWMSKFFLGVFFYHNPLMLTCSYPNEVKWQKSRRFRFEASWLKHPEYPELIKQVWRVKVQGRDKWRAIQGKLHVCKKSIQQ